MCDTSRFGEYVQKNIRETVVLIQPTNETVVLLKEALKVLRKSFCRGIPYKKAGVTVSGLQDIAFITEGMFIEKTPWKDIDTTVDSLNNQYGQGTIMRGVVHRTSLWKEQAQYQSPEYTTRWSDISKVKAI